MSSAPPAPLGNVVSLMAGTDKLTMSLQRHHYRFCAGGASAPMNSLMYAEVTDAQVNADLADLKTIIDGILGKKGGVDLLYGKRLTTVTSKRAFMVDNSALQPKQKANHFFVVDGPSVWAKMTAAQYQAASAVRRIEEAIRAKANGGDKTDYLDAKTVLQLDPKNPVKAAYLNDKQFVNKLPTSDDAMLGKVSGQSRIVAVARQLK